MLVRITVNILLRTGVSDVTVLSNGWRDIWMCRAFVILEMVERILLLQVESEMDG